MAIQLRNDLDASFRLLRDAVEGWNAKNPAHVLVIIRSSKNSTFLDISRLAFARDKEVVQMNDFGRLYSTRNGRAKKMFNNAAGLIETVGNSLKFDAELREKIAARRDENAKAREAHRRDVEKSIERCRELGLKSGSGASLHFLKEQGAKAFVIKVVFSDGVTIKIPGTDVDTAVARAKEILGQ